MPSCSALLAFLSLAAAGPKAAGTPPACAPAASLSGEARVVAPIGRLLIQRGIARATGAGCAEVTVDVGLAQPGFDLFITDPEGRTARRQLHSAEAAATLIESWARAGLVDRDLDLRERPTAAVAPVPSRQMTPPARPTPAAVTEPQPRSLVASATPPGPPRAVLLAPAMIHAAGETSLASDRLLWLGAGAGACFRVGVACTGLVGRWARSDGAIGGEATGWDHLWEAQALAVVSAPLGLGPFRITPELGVGAGRVEGVSSANEAARALDARSSRSHDRRWDSRRRSTTGMATTSTITTTPSPFPNIAPAPSAATGSTDLLASTWRADGLRASAGLAISLPLSGQLAIHFDLAAETSFASFNTTPLAADLPQVSPHRLRAGFGLRYGQR